MFQDESQRPDAMLLRSTWIRRAYHVEGAFIKPVLNSKVIEYDPFRGLASFHSGMSDDCLYSSLVQLNENDPDDVARFCCKFGLLGLSLHNLPRYTKRGALDASTAGSDLPNLCFAVPRELMLATDADEETFSTPLAGDRQKHDWVVCGEEAIKLYYRHYIKSISPRRITRWTPAWFHHEFPDIVCEPIAGFQECVARFRRAYDAMTGSDTELSRGWAKAQINSNLNGVHPIAEETGPESRASWGLRWRFPSLLSCAYMMLLLDITRVPGARRCANEICRRPFTADRADNQYCSPKCQAAAKQRRRRRRVKEERLGGNR